MKISTKATFTHDVTVLVPSDEGHTEDTLRTTFNLVDQDRLRQIDVATPAGSDRFFEEIVDSFHDCQDGDGRAVPYSLELRHQLLKMPYVRLALGRHYFSACSKVKEGN